MIRIFFVGRNGRTTVRVETQKTYRLLLELLQNSSFKRIESNHYGLDIGIYIRFNLYKNGLYDLIEKYGLKILSYVSLEPEFSGQDMQFSDTDDTIYI